MKILLTGGAGYIGTHTCIELINAGYDIVVCDNFVNSQPESMNRAMQITGKTFPVYALDCRDEAKLEVLFEQEKDGLSYGHAGNYCEVIVKGENLRNNVLNVQINGISGTSLLGDIIL